MEKPLSSAIKEACLDDVRVEEKDWTKEGWNMVWSNPVRKPLVEPGAG